MTHPPKKLRCGETWDEGRRGAGGQGKKAKTAGGTEPRVLGESCMHDE